MIGPSSPASGDNSFIIATANAGKRAEFTGLLIPLLDPAWTIFDRNTFPTPLPPIDEDRPTFTGNALKKAAETARSTGCCALADDSGLSVDALKGAPGVHSSRFAGDNADDQANNDLLLQKLEDIPPQQRTARFITVLCLAMPHNKIAQSLLSKRNLSFEDLPTGIPNSPHILTRQDDLAIVYFRGELRGKITTAPRGHQGFGYDPLFELPHLKKTLAQLSPEDKNALSHRAEAAQKLLHFFA